MAPPFHTTNANLLSSLSFQDRILFFMRYGVKFLSSGRRIKYKVFFKSTYVHTCGYRSFFLGTFTRGLASVSKSRKQNPNELSVSKKSVLCLSCCLFVLVVLCVDDLWRLFSKVVKMNENCEFQEAAAFQGELLCLFGNRCECAVNEEDSIVTSVILKFGKTYEPRKQ